MAGVLNMVRQSEAHMPSCSVTDCDDFIESALVDSNMHVYIKEDEWEITSRSVIDGKESKTYS